MEQERGTALCGLPWADFPEYAEMHHYPSRHPFSNYSYRYVKSAHITFVHFIMNSIVVSHTKHS